MRITVRTVMKKKGQENEAANNAECGYGDTCDFCINIAHQHRREWDLNFKGRFQCPHCSK